MLHKILGANRHQSNKTLTTEGMDKHAGMTVDKYKTLKAEGWVNMQEYHLHKTANGISQGVGHHAGMVGQHKQEWWVNMLRNLQHTDIDENMYALFQTLVHRNIEVYEFFKIALINSEKFRNGEWNEGFALMTRAVEYLRIKNSKI
jgi:hypothetical protein